MSSNNQGKFNVNFKLNKSLQEKSNDKQPSSVFYHSDICLVTEFIKNKFYLATLVSGKNEPKQTDDIYFFSIDDKLVYHNFYSDFGPLNLGCLYKYCWKVNHKFNNSRYQNKQIVHYTTHDEQKRSNAAFLIASYSILYLQMSPKDAYKILLEGNNQHQFRNFQDASVGRSPYTIRLQDCLNGLYKAATFGFFNFGDFNINEYKKYQQLKYGDLNWIVPQKFLAFIGPSTQPGTAYHPPEHYLEYFLKNQVKTVIRLNRESYDSSRFIKNGICHHDLFLPDGSIPSPKILNKFLKLAENTDGPIAVHCKAGLGRTGTLIAAYLIKHYKMTAKEAIAWIRICRPGSVIGHQQSWLENIQNDLWHSGEQYKLHHFGNTEVLVQHKRGIYSLNDDKLKFIKKCSSPEKTHESPRYSHDNEEKYMKNNDLKNNSKKNFEHPSSSRNKSGLVRLFGKFKGIGDQLTNDRHERTESIAKNKQIGSKSQVDRNISKNSQLTQGDFLNKIKFRREN